MPQAPAVPGSRYLPRTMKEGMSLEHKIGIGFWVGVVLFMLSQILLVVFAIAFFLGHFVWPQ
jgi:hypothetical protein